MLFLNQWKRGGGVPMKEYADVARIDLGTACIYRKPELLRPILGMGGGGGATSKIF